MSKYRAHTVKGVQPEKMTEKADCMNVSATQMSWRGFGSRSMTKEAVSRHCPASCQTARQKRSGRIPCVQAASQVKIVGWGAV